MAHGETRPQALERLRREGRGEPYRHIYKADLKSPIIQSLSAGARCVWTYLFASCPPWGWAVSRSALARELNINVRTLTKNLALLYEAGLVAVEGTGGGSHQSTNRYFVYRPDPKSPPRTGSRLWRKWFEEGRIPPVPAVPSVDRPAEPVEPGPQAEPDDLPADLGPSAPAAAVPALRELTDDERSAILEVYDHVLPDLEKQLLRPGVAQPLEQRESLWHWAEGAGIVPPGTAPEPSPACTPSPDAADPSEIVNAFLNQWNIARAPLRVELQIARGLIKAHGPEGAWRLLRLANARLVDLRRSGRGQDPLTMRYLEPHLSKVGARWSLERPPDASEGSSNSG